MCHLGFFREMYEKNRRSVMNYRWWRYEELPRYEKLLVRNIRVKEGKKGRITKIDRHKKSCVVIHRTNINTSPLLRSFMESQLIQNEFNLYHWEYLMDNVRDSMDFGDDNHIYMQYDSIESFCILLLTEDITKFLRSEKFIFLFGEASSENYRIDFKKDYGIDYDLMKPQPVRINELNRIVFNWFIDSYTGSAFFAELLDYHINFLSLKEFGLSKFTYLYTHLLKQHTVREVKEIMKNNLDINIFWDLEYLFIPVDPYFSYHAGEANPVIHKKFNVPNPMKFFDELVKLFPHPDYKPSQSEWFKGIFLAYANALERNINHRLIPAILFTIHPLNCLPDISKKELYDILHFFKYFKGISIIRRPTSLVGALCNFAYKSGRDSFQNYMETWMRHFEFEQRREWKDESECYSPLNIDKTDELLKYRGVVRFEDIKMFPRASLEAICDFVDVSWDDTLLHTTLNGTRNSMNIISNKPIEDFDTSPVWNRHEEVYGSFDYYRMEILFSDNYIHWGYKPIYYRDAMKYTKQEILNLFSVRFKCEKMQYTKKQRDSLPDVRRRMILLIEKKISEREKNNFHYIPIHWIKPKAELVNGKLYE